LKILWAVTRFHRPRIFLAGLMKFGSLLFTPAVKELQERFGSRKQYDRFVKTGESQDRLTEYEREFLSERDSFYWATTSATGWPYVQHRGGPKGFLKVIDDRTIAFADFSGNKQFITTGNLATDNRVAMILVSYPQQARLKILGKVDVHEGDEAAPWLPQVKIPGYKANIERVFVIHIEAFDWNCPQHITPRYTAEEINEAIAPLQGRIRALEAENEALKRDLAKMPKSPVLNPNN
jgi:uncharacterized protein